MTEPRKSGPVGVADRPTTQAHIPEPPPAGAMVQARPTVLMGREGIVKDALQGLLPSSAGEAMQMSQWFAKSKAVPKYLHDKPETVFTIIMAGLEIGLTPMRAIQNLQNIHGNLGMKADLQLALVRKSGLMSYFDEGYEEVGVTDMDLAERTRDGAKILALVKAVPKGKPYGWTTVQRRGEDQLVTRVFSFVDAERAFTYEKEDEDSSAKGVKKKLSEKFNFQAWPMDMYPKRSRVRVVAIVFPDVTAGIPAIEHLMDRAVVEGEVIGADDEDAPDADMLMHDILQADEDLGKRIAAGFDQLKIAGAKKLQKLVQFRGKPGDLFAWLQQEYALLKTRGTGGKKQADVLTQPAAAAPAAAAPAPAEPAQPVQEAEVIAEPEPEQPATPTPPATTSKLDRLKNMGSF